MPAPVTTTPPVTAVPNPTLNAIPGETVDQYESRLGGTTGGATGTGFTPNPTGDGTISAEDQVAKSLGYNSYNDALTQLTAAPTQSETDLYNNAYTAAGLDALSNTINQKQSDLTSATGKINDNPWLDEASRVGRVKTVTDMATADIKNSQDEYNTKLKSVEDLVKQETADQNTTTASNKAKLAALESSAKQLAASQAATTKTSTAAPKTIKGASGATYQWNAATNSFDQILPGKPATPAKAPVPDASPTGTGPQFNNFNFSATQLGALNAKGLNQSDANGILTDIKSGQTLDNIRQQMQASGIDPGLLDTIMFYVDPAHNTPAKKTSTSSSSSSRTL